MKVGRRHRRLLDARMGTVRVKGQGTRGKGEGLWPAVRRIVRRKNGDSPDWVASAESVVTCD